MELWEFARTWTCQSREEKEGRRRASSSIRAVGASATIRSTTGEILGKIKERDISQRDHRAVLFRGARRRGGREGEEERVVLEASGRNNAT